MRECDCPFFCKESAAWIRCAAALIRLPSADAKRDYMDRYCGVHYKQCSLYMAQSKHRREIDATTTIGREHMHK